MIPAWGCNKDSPKRFEVMEQFIFSSFILSITDSARSVSICTGLNFDSGSETGHNVHLILQ